MLDYGMMVQGATALVSLIAGRVLPTVAHARNHAARLLYTYMVLQLACDDNHGERRSRAYCLDGDGGRCCYGYAGRCYYIADVVLALRARRR